MTGKKWLTIQISEEKYLNPQFYNPANFESREKFTRAKKNVPINMIFLGVRIYHSKRKKKYLRKDNMKYKNQWQVSITKKNERKLAGSWKEALWILKVRIVSFKQEKLVTKGYSSFFMCSVAKLLLWKQWLIIITGILMLGKKWFSVKQPIKGLLIVVEQTSLIVFFGRLCSV